MSKLQRECIRIADRARSLRIRDLRYAIDGDRVLLDGEALTPDGADSAVKLFASSSAREVVSRIVHAPPDSSRPGSLGSPAGYVHIENLGPDGARLAETILWEVRPGDDLPLIAEAIYGDRDRIDPIVRANPSLAGQRGQLTVGRRIRVPAP